jgi:hypothetical protein
MYNPRMVTESTSLKLGDDVTFQGLGDGQDTVILSLASGYLYTCNDTTAAFLSAVDGKRTVAQIVDQLLEQYEVDRQKLEADLLGIADKLVEEKLLAVAESS